ncbi:MAG: 5'/3'-nucleotidase SurE [Polyangiales bacterium]
MTTSSTTKTAADDRPLILCANDDGIFSKGLTALAEALSAFARVVGVAPETEQSAMSHSLTLHRPLRLRRVADDRYALDGTPADCVYLALHLGEGTGTRALLPRRPDLVVSGINRGINLGQDVFYSGTVAAAREGALRGVPSIAVSVGVVADPSGISSFDPSHGAVLISSIARSMLAIPKKATDPTPLVNVNIPAGPVRGIAATRLGTRLWTEAVEARVDPRGRPYYWIGGRGVKHEGIKGSDTEAFDAGLASLTVLNLDLARQDPIALKIQQEILAEIQRMRSRPNA